MLTGLSLLLSYAISHRHCLRQFSGFCRSKNGHYDYHDYDFNDHDKRIRKRSRFWRYTARLRGVHDNYGQTSGEGANTGETVTDPTITGDPNTIDSGDTVKADCFGKVNQHQAQEHKDDPNEGTLGSHASDPVPEVPGNETPRQGIGNQDQGHPAAHGAFNSQFEEDDAENVEQNC